jgi:hypothetical protein
MRRCQVRVAGLELLVELLVIDLFPDRGQTQMGE